MYTPSEKHMFEAWAVKHGNHKLSAEGQQITHWISEQFGVKALNFFKETKQTSKGEQLLIHVILETADDIKKMQTNADTTRMIAEQVTAVSIAQPGVIVTYRPLQPIDGEKVKEMRADEKWDILKGFERAWTISQNVVFYYTDQQIKDNHSNGISNQIADAFRTIDGKYGGSEFSDYRFDSKESFDRDYESKWHYYWK